MASDSSSWVVEMEEMLLNTDPSLEMARWKQHSIYRVPERIKRTTNREVYEPQVVSLGPFHHGEHHLLPMEEHKRRAMLQFVKRAGKPLGEFVASIEEVVDKLQDAYEGLDEKWRGANSGRFVEMMVVDGCFLLEIILQFGDYGPNDPVFSNLYLLVDIRNDVVVMENQLPLLAVQRLVEAICLGTSPSAKEVNNMVLRYLERPLMDDMDNLGLHPLDVLHKSYCGPASMGRQGSEVEDTMPSAVELSQAGVQFKKSNTEDIGGVDFESGVLSMPVVRVDDGTEKDFLNLMAFERLVGDVGDDVTSYVIFIDIIINSESDVALLKSKGVIVDMLGSDKALANLFNTLNKGALLSPNSWLNDVQRKVNAHCKKRRNKWCAIFEHKYLSNPWVFISLIGAIILLVATVMQTIYTVVPFYTKS
ncbi:hypothetical protein SEVIR_8G152000v4 [Setaria viridis]|uniref:Uncharacterized protein n=1 Tax=Setaria viridis TaxID=4556 RepID=A0A4V6D3B0_SETVI|nr:UPF0481 protein At3g47200-like [Setaria viridis]TKW01056.1 hypothetical protein SEVIR_8G152000v2 [Setaria viridis]